MAAATTDLNDVLLPGQPLPADHLMVAKALEILSASPHGQQLSNFVEKKGIVIKIARTPEPVSYLPEKKLVYVGFNRNNAISPGRFILMLAGILREAQQEAAGIKHPDLQAPLAEHKKVSMAKHEDKLWYICTIASELDAQSAFMDYKFLDELRKMGHSEALDLYLQQEGKGS
ncbi:MAG: hypothetical protein KGL10_02980 [Alphaproteobacteria bacterium]|nr:hypothetical protein [Alphaproteobacteria bacterium]